MSCASTDDAEARGPSQYVTTRGVRRHHECSSTDTSLPAVALAPRSGGDASTVRLPTTAGRLQSPGRRQSLSSSAFAAVRHHDSVRHQSPVLRGSGGVADDATTVRQPTRGRHLGGRHPSASASTVPVVRHRNSVRQHLSGRRRLPRTPSNSPVHRFKHSSQSVADRRRLFADVCVNLKLKSNVKLIMCY